MQGSIEKLRLSQEKHLSAWQAEGDMFIPLSGCSDPTDLDIFNLDEAVNRFLSDPQQQVLLLVGHAATGKTRYAQSLAMRLWGNRATVGAPIPLWISLPNCKNPEKQAIEETFDEAGLDDAQREALRQSEPFIFILDAYDEIRSVKNLAATHQLWRWKAKTIITCRHEYLYEFENFRSLFAAYNYQIKKIDYLTMTVLFIQPFQSVQIQAYLKAYLNQHPESAWQSGERYEQTIEALPGIKALVKIPYVLTLVVEALPRICKTYDAVENPAEKLALIRAALYDIVIPQWFARQEKKLRETPMFALAETIHQEGWAFAIALVKLMRQHGIIQVDYEPPGMSAFDLDEAEHEENPFAPFFDRTNPRLAILHSLCLLREVTLHHYAFLDSSLMDYFLQRGMVATVASKPLKSSIELITAVAHRSGSPLHQLPPEATEERSPALPSKSFKSNDDSD